MIGRDGPSAYPGRKNPLEIAGFAAQVEFGVNMAPDRPGDTQLAGARAVEGEMIERAGRSEAVEGEIERDPPAHHSVIKFHLDLIEC